MFQRKGQSTLEYVIILTAIVAAVIVGAKVVGGKVGNSMSSVATKMDDKVSTINLGGK